MYKELYNEMDALLYSVTDVEGIMTWKEKSSLLEKVNEILFSGSGQKMQLREKGLNERSSASQEKLPPKMAINNFLDFIDDHLDRFDAKLNNACFVVASKLYEIYNHTSLQEKKLVEELFHRFEMAVQNNKGGESHEREF
jgi:hypothetical protein